MKRIKLLDCTLRDGGYVNNWKFGNLNIRYILRNLSQAGIDFLECGYLSNKHKFGIDESKYNNIYEIEKDIENALTKVDDGTCIYICMLNLGEYELDDIPQYQGGKISGIRLAFHKKDYKDAIVFTSELKKRGYKVFVQPMITNGYCDSEILELIELVNHIEPFGFYIVDSFGVMQQRDLMRLMYLIDNNLKKEICLGYHAHNNLQMAYSNAQVLFHADLEREIIIDATTFGMGRGAGNLNTELFSRYLNEHSMHSYKLERILEIIDNVLNNIYLEYRWGYSLPYYLSASYSCHPNYATYLVEKNVLTIISMEEILSQIPNDKKNRFDKEFISELYIQYQAGKCKAKASSIEKLVSNKVLLLLGSGKSIVDYELEIKEFISLHNALTISTNFLPEYIDIDYIFMSNEKRFERILSDENKINLEGKLIVTSNIINCTINHSIVVDYSELINQEEVVQDNALLLLLKLLINSGKDQVYLAGFDGYSYDMNENYSLETLKIPYTPSVVKKHNFSVEKALGEYKNKIQIHFITPSKYER